MRRGVRRAILPAGLGVAATLLPAGAAPAANIADFQDDFQTGTPKAGWSYRWNATGPFGTDANYRPLVSGGSGYVVNPADPNAGNGAGLTVATGAADPAMFPPAPAGPPPLPSTYVRPGLGGAQASDAVEHTAVIGYTISAAQIAAFGNQLELSDYNFRVSSTSADGVTARIYINDMPTGIDFTFPANFTFYTALDPSAFPAIPVNAGDTFNIIIGGAGTNVGDEIRMDYTLSLTPEPTGLLPLVGAAGLLARRRRRSRA